MASDAAYGPDVERLSRLPIGESDKYDTQRILDALPDLLREDSDAGEALRDKLGLRFEKHTYPPEREWWGRLVSDWTEVEP